MYSFLSLLTSNNLYRKGKNGESIFCNIFNFENPSLLLPFLLPLNHIWAAHMMGDSVSLSLTLYDFQWSFTFSMNTEAPTFLFCSSVPPSDQYMIGKKNISWRYKVWEHYSPSLSSWWRKWFVCFVVGNLFHDGRGNKKSLWALKIYFWLFFLIVTAYKIESCLIIVTRILTSTIVMIWFMSELVTEKI